MYRTLNSYLQETFGGKVYKLALSTGCTCPNRDGTIGTRGCIFCTGSGEFAQSPSLSVSDQIENAKMLVSDKARCVGYIAYFQDFTNTYAPAERLRPLFLEAAAHEDIVAVSIATRPDCLPPEILSLLSELRAVKPVWVELGLQTVHEKTAAYLRRGYELPVFEAAVRALQAENIDVIAHMILGLPGETPDMTVETARYLGRLGVQGVKLHLLHVLQGTDLAADYAAGSFRTLEMEEYFDLLARCLRVLPKDVVIHRLTGDGAKRDLIAPVWSADKKRVLNAMQRYFASIGLEQGSDL